MRSHPDLSLLGWKVVEEREHTTLWRDDENDFLSLVEFDKAPTMPWLGDPDQVVCRCRTMAAGLGANLVEAERVDHVDGPGVLFVCRRMQNRALVFTGAMLVPTSHGTWMWEMVAKGQPAKRDLRDMCEDCTCEGHPMARVCEGLRKLLAVPLEPAREKSGLGA